MEAQTLEINSVSAYYGDTKVLWDISLAVALGRIVALLGSNGAGKTTTLRSVCGLLPIRSGEIKYNGKVISGMASYEIAALGITLIPEGRQLFPQMSVEDNLLVGSFLKRDKKRREENISRVYELFPQLSSRKKQWAENLSGGEQQMLAIGRGMMQEPKVMMFDEPSLGLSPFMVKEVFSVVNTLHKQGITIFLVEQNVRQTLKITDYCYVIENGRIVQKGTGKELEEDPKIRQTYLGL